MTNACLLSMMADLRLATQTKTKETPEVGTNDDKTKDGMDRCLAMFVKKIHCGRKSVVKCQFVRANDFRAHLADQLTERQHEEIWDKAKNVAI